MIVANKKQREAIDKMIAKLLRIKVCALKIADPRSLTLLLKDANKEVSHLFRTIDNNPF